MATIPLPALDLRPVQPPENPLQQYGQVVQLQNLMKQQQLIPGQLQAQQQQLQSGGLDIQEKQLQLQSQKALKDAYLSTFGSQAGAAKATELGDQAQSAAASPSAQPTGAQSGAPASPDLTSAPAQSLSAQPSAADRSAPASSGGSYSDKIQQFVAKAAANGATIGDIQGITGKMLALQKDTADLTKTQLENKATQNKNSSQLLQPVGEAAPKPNEDPAAGIAKQKMLYGQLQAQVRSDPNAGETYGAQNVQTLLNTSYESPDQISLMLTHLGGQKSLLDDAKTRAETTATEQKTAPLSTDQLAQINAGFAARQQVLNPGQPSKPAFQLQPGATPSDFERIDKILQATENALGTKAQRDNTNAIRQQSLQIAQQAANDRRALLTSAGKMVPGATGAAALANLDPLTQSAVQQIGDGKLDFSTFASRMPPEQKLALAGMVHQYNPDFNQQTYDISKKVGEAFTSGNYSQQLNAINTAREHMKTFSSLADALNNGDVQAANKIGNAVGVQFGADKATNFKIAAQAFGGEVGKAFDGAGVTQSERESASSAFNPNMSPAQLKGAVQTVDSLLSGKQKALQQTYDTGKQAKPNFGTQTQSAQPVAVPTATGPNGHKIVVEGGRWVDAETHQPI